jgi:DeoR/GlpR family transcriptional regulator of sugar metabolism
VEDDRVVGTRSSEASVEARREQILEQVLEEGQIGIGELARRYGVSEMTVHRDLDALSGAGFLTKERGRAVAPPALRVQTSAVFRLRAGAHLKEAVARAALALVGEPRTVLVDDSTSVLPLLRMLGDAGGGPLTVVSNYLEVMRRSAAYPTIDAHLLGGDYAPDLDATFGPVTVEAIARSRVDVTVFSVPAVRQGRCYHSLERSAALKQAALAAADRSILLLDHTKTPRTGPHLICDIGRFDAVVVDDEADPAEIRAMRAAGTHVELVPAATMTEL